MRSARLVLPLPATAEAGRIYLSSDGGPLNQNLVLVLITPLFGVFGGKKVLFRVPRDDQEMVR
jgi:hypothetical protein